ncbi:MAG: sarcosine oxidase subunit gamma family protein [Candidatus Binataceae bacterium]
MSDFTPIARSPIAPAAPFALLNSWEVSHRQSSAALRLLDLTACAKLLLRGAAPPALRDLLPPFGHSRRAAAGPMIIASIPQQWLLIGAPGALPVIQAWIASTLDHSPLTFTDLTHARVLLRLAGAASAMLLAKVCAINFAPAAFPNGRAVRSSLAKVPCEIVRDDLLLSGHTIPRSGVAASPCAETLSYLIICDRPVGQYIFDALMDAGSEFKIDIDGFSFD